MDVSIYLSRYEDGSWVLNLGYYMKYSHNSTTSQFSYDTIKGLPYSDPLFDNFTELSTATVPDGYYDNGYGVYHAYDDFLMTGGVTTSYLYPYIFTMIDEDTGGGTAVHTDDAENNDAPAFIAAGHQVNSYDIQPDTLVDLYTHLQNELIDTLGDPPYWDEDELEALIPSQLEVEHGAWVYHTHTPVYAKYAIGNNTDYHEAQLWQIDDSTGVYCSLDISPYYDEVFVGVSLVYFTVSDSPPEGAQQE